MEVHYQSTFFKRNTLREAARSYLRWLPKDVNILLSTGSSGCAIASAMVALSDSRPLRHVFVRKSYEMKVHGNRFVGFEYDMADESKCAIVDDFIHTGRTIRRLLRAIPERGLIATTVLIGNSGGFNQVDVIKKLERQHRIEIIIV